jgi:hypothetical protein
MGLNDQESSMHSASVEQHRQAEQQTDAVSRIAPNRHGKACQAWTTEPAEN